MGSGRVKRGWLIAGIIVGGALALCPIWSSCSPVQGVKSGSSALGEPGISDPEHRSDTFGVILFLTLLSYGVGVFGMTLFALCLFFYLREQKKTPPPLPR